ncbi:MAG TPA: ATP cone domain-containing protein, partial [Oceanipulchritudo sp.]|nr:ATP cone domain-containing protein [Oceanipulchritudo sp.]
MIKHPAYEEDVALKRFSRSPDENKPRYDWRGIVDDSVRFPADMIPSSVKVEAGDSVVDFDLAEVAETVGIALTNLILSRDEKETDIYNDKNCSFVAAVSSRVATRLGELASEGRPLTLSESEIYLLIEKTLIESDAPDVAKSLLLLRKSTRSPARPVKLTASVIRRNHKIVPWDTTKVEIAVRKAFLTLGLDSEPAVEVADAVAANILNQRISRVHIEEVQDIVQEELMRLGHFKVAEAYILYRAHRRHLRAGTEDASTTEDDRQESMIMVTRSDGSNVLWDGLDLRKRIEFAMIGLDLCLAKDEIETELRRSLYSEMSEEDLRKTIILNAKSLIERDADFTRFAGRILLTYIYEEVLDWDIARDGIGKLKEAHQKGFRRYLQRGIQIKRLNPVLLERYDIGQLALCLDPGADMDFDYLGIQTLYDRYLIVDKMGGHARRLEVPQFFWMRVS